MEVGASDDTRPAPTLGPARTSALRLESVGSSAGLARRFVRSHLESVEQETVDTALLVVTELVTNAIVHAQGPIDVTLALTDEALLVRVADCEPTRPTQRPVSAGSTNGRGIALVATVSQDWGAIVHDDGKIVWSLILRPT